MRPGPRRKAVYRRNFVVPNNERDYGNPMSATIHTLFSGPSSVPVPEHPLLAELRDSSRQILDELVRKMFDSADDALFDMGEKAHNDSERRRYFDTMRVLRIDRNRVTREFSQQLECGFTTGIARPQASGNDFDLDNLSIQPTEELEEKIALSNLATKAEGLYKGLIWDLERRLEIAQARGIPVSPQALSPTRICDAFGAATAILDTEFQVKLVIYKLFDRVISRELDRVYKAALELLDRHDIDTRKPAPTAPPWTGAATPPRPAGLAMQSALELLHKQGFDSSGAGIASDPAAQQLVETLQTLLDRGGVESVAATTQRLSMASRVFDEVLGDPLLSDTLRSTLEPLRYPVYRTALADPAFFTAATHPTRKMLGDLIELAAATQTGEVSPARFRSLLQSAINQTNGAASAGIGAESRYRALSGLELDSFLEELREQTRSRRAALLLHVRRLVAQELELRTIGRDVPKAIQTLLRSGIGPLMAVRLLKNGRSSGQFRDAEGLLDRVLASLESTPPPAQPDLKKRERLIDDATAAFREIGMADEKMATLLDGLRKTYGALDEPPVETAGETPLNDIEKAHLLSDFALPKPAPEPAKAATGETHLPSVTVLELLSRVLTPESWFRVFDAAQNQTRWLKLASFYANQDSVTFTGFDESTKLSLRATRLADDLVQGYSEPINPNASAREALEQLRHARTQGLL